MKKFLPTSLPFGINLPKIPSRFTLRSEATKGFTLVELLVVVSIISILATVGISTFSNLQKSSRDAKRKSDLVITQSVLEQYRADQNFYPAALSFGGALTSPDGKRTYITTLPVDSQVNDPEGLHQYHYVASPLSCDNSAPDKLCTTYCLDANLENPSTPITSCTGDSDRNFKVTPP